MLKKLKGLKWSLILASLLYLVLGIALLVWPNTSNFILCCFVAVILTGYGVFNVIGYFEQERGPVTGLVIGVICAAFGIYALFQPLRISDIISLILGLVILVNGAVSLRRSLKMRAQGFPQWWAPFILDIIVLLLGVVVNFNPTLFANFLLQVIGVVLIYESLSDLWAIHQLSKLAHTAAQAISDAAALETDAYRVEDSAK